MSLSVKRSVGGLVVLSGCAIGGQVALANPGIEVIFTKIPQHPTSLIPGAQGAAGQPDTTNFRAFHDLALSPDGTTWMLRGRTQLGSGLENIMLKGSETSGSMFAQAGQPIEGGQPGEVYDFFGSAMGRFNSSNQYAYAARASGGVSGNAQKILFWDGTMQVVRYQQGDPIIGLIDLPPNPSGDELFGNSVGSVHLMDLGDIGLQDSTIQNIHTSRRPALMYNDVAFQQNGVDTLVGMNGTTIHTWGGIAGGPSANSFYSSADGSSWIARGRIADEPTTSDEVLVVNGHVVLQKGSPIPGSSIIINSFVQADMSGNGDWIARGTIVGGGAWAVYNGQLVAATGMPIASGTTELWGSSFFGVALNRVGDWVLMGSTQILDPAVDNVLVINGERVLVRKGEPVDLTGLGITDGVYIGRADPSQGAFSTSGLQIDDNQMVYFFASIRNAQGVEYNSDPAFSTPLAFMRINAKDSEPCYANCDGSTVEPILNVDDFTCFINEFAVAQSLPHEQQVTHYANCDNSTTAPVLNVDDFTCFINAFAAGCP